MYLDTSVVVAALTEEQKTISVQTWLHEQPSGSLFISDWVVTEFAAALSIKLRSGKIGPVDRDNALTMFARLSAESFSRLPIAGPHFHEAARLANQSNRGLRAGDALHLAICATADATLCTLDRRLAEAGPALAIKTLLL